MDRIREQLDKNQDITDARVLKVLQKREIKWEAWDNDERRKFIEAVKEHGRNNSLISMHVGTKNYQ